MLKRILFVFLVAIAASFSSKAQVTTSALGGTVKSATDEPLVGATIVATHLPTGTKYTTVTRAGGAYNIQNMRVGGPYTVEISFVGYKVEKADDVYLQLAEAFLLNPVMNKAETALENVVVTTATRRNTILNANRTGATTSVGRREINTLPTISRSINDIARLTPQANGQAVAGGNYRQNNITVDGSDFNNSFGIGGNLPANGSPISLDAIEEIAVNITPFDVRQSGFIGSALNAVTRSGTNQFQASAYTFWRNENLQGDKVDRTNIVKQNLQQNIYGGRIGGPIIKNKLFYFVSFETEKTINPGQSKIASATPTSFGTASNIARPTVAELDAISTYLRSTYGYETGPYQNYDLESNAERVLVRLDWNINAKNKLNVRYSQTESKDPSLISSSTTGTGIVSVTGNRNDVFALHFKNSNYYQERNFYSIAAELNSSLGKRLSNVLRFSYNNQNEPRSSDSQVFPLVDIMKDGRFFTTFGSEPFTYGNTRDVKIYSLVDNLSISTGKHNMLLGVQADFTKTINGFQPVGTSYYRYNSWQDFVNNSARPLNYGITYSLRKDYSQAFPTFKFAQYSAFFQDEVSANKNLKVTFGVRADLSSFPDVTEVKENPLVSGLTFAGGRKVNTGVLPKSRIVLSPRLGFNWDLYGDRSLQIRGGTGIFAGRIPNVWIVGQSGNSGMLQLSQAYDGTAVDNAIRFSPNIGQHLPANPPAAGTSMPSTVTVVSPDFKTPQTWKTSLAIDVKLPGGIIGTLEGIYNRDYNSLYSRNINLAAPASLGVNGYPDKRMIYPAATAAKYINKLASGGPGILVPSASGTTALSVIESGNETRGHSGFLTMRFEKPFKKGFSAMLAYTKSLSNRLFDGTGDQPFNTWSLISSVNGANTPNLSYGDDNIPDRVVASLSYRKEYLKHLATTVSFFYSGSIAGRFTYVYSSDFNRDGANADPIYIPKDRSEIDFVDQVVNGINYTAAVQKEMFFSYIAQDKYLRAHMGQYAERNGAQLPWRGQLDFRFVQELFSKIGKNKNTLSFSVDIFNFGNMLYPKWGRFRQLNATNGQILVPQNVAALVAGGTVRPTFRLATDRGQLITQTFRDNQSIASTYYTQLGLRYSFN
jgi:Carboxypeptidase regulatory-like domain